MDIVESIQGEAEVHTGKYQHRWSYPSTPKGGLFQVDVEEHEPAFSSINGGKLEG
jgi:hypothetical protein